MRSSWAPAASAKARSRRLSRWAGSGAMKLTTQRYYTPSGRSIQAKGIDPDIEIEQSTVEPLRRGPQRKESDLRRSLKKAKTRVGKGATRLPSPPLEEKTEEAEKKPERPFDYQLVRALDLMRGISLYRSQAVNQGAQDPGQPVPQSALPRLPKLPWKRGDDGMGMEEDGFDEPDAFSEPNPLQGNCRFTLYGARRRRAAVPGRNFIWLQFPSEAIEAELRAMRPNFTKVPPLRRSALAPEADKGARAEGDARPAMNPRDGAEAHSAVCCTRIRIRCWSSGRITACFPSSARTAASPGGSIRGPSTFWRSVHGSVVVTGLGVSFKSTQMIVGILPGAK